MTMCSKQPMSRYPQLSKKLSTPARHHGTSAVHVVWYVLVVRLYHTNLLDIAR